MAKFGFHKGWSGSPAHTGYEANEGIDARPPSERGPRIGAGVLGTRVEMEVERDGGKVGKKRGGSKED